MYAKIKDTCSYRFLFSIFLSQFSLVENLSITQFQAAWNHVEWKNYNNRYTTSKIYYFVLEYFFADYNSICMSTEWLTIYFFLFSLLCLDELGDYDKEIHTENYVSSLKLALRQNHELEKKVIEAHRKREPEQDIVNVYDEFIAIARGLETYGIDPHPVKDFSGAQLYVGINFSGVSTLSVGKRIQHFRWSEISKINFEGKMFIIHLTYTVDREVKKHTVGFKCANSMICRYVWRCAIEQMFFFT